MGHQACNAAIAVNKRMNPHQAMMRRGSTQDRIRLAEVVVNLLEALQKTRHGAGTDSDMSTDLDVFAAQFAGDDPYTFFRLPGPPPTADPRAITRRNGDGLPGCHRL